MCQIRESIPSYKVKKSGYKIVAIKDGKCYSPVTGIEYISGKDITVPPISKSLKSSIQIDMSFRNVMNPNEFSHNANYKGFTAIFVRKNDAISEMQGWGWWLKSGYKLKVIPATISTNLHYGRYFNLDVYIGKRLTFNKRDIK